MKIDQVQKLVSLIRVEVIDAFIKKNSTIWFERSKQYQGTLYYFHFIDLYVFINCIILLTNRGLRQFLNDEFTARYILITLV